MRLSVKNKVLAIQFQYDYMSPQLVALFETEKQKALDDFEQAEAFLEKATEIEALAVLSELSLREPLNNESYKMMMHLSCKVFNTVGVPDLPDFINDAEMLTKYEQDKLDRFRRKIREQQFRKRRKHP